LSELKPSIVTAEPIDDWSVETLTAYELRETIVLSGQIGHSKNKTSAPVDLELAGDLELRENAKVTN
jgi:hypothetical protein